MKFSKIIVTAVVLLNAGFAIAVLLLSKGDHVVPDSLIVAWFAFTTGELWAISSIKKAEVRKNVKKTGE